MLRFTTAGESHGRALVAVLEGLPAGLPVNAEQVNRELERRQWGYGRGGRMKIERDRVEIISGVRHGLTLGSPLALMIENKDWANWTEVMSAEPADVPPEKSRRVKRPRPGHADLAGGQKYGARDLRNILERASASAQRSGASPGIAAMASQVSSRGFSGMPPSCMTWLRISTPKAASSCFASAPQATRAAVSRADARSRMFLKSRAPYFCPPARSA